MARISTLLIGFPLGLCFLLLGATFMTYAAPRSQVLACQRMATKQSTCKISHQLFGITVQQAPLNALQRAKVGDVGEGDTGETYYQVFLQQATETTVFGIYPTLNQADVQTTAAQINQFLQDEKQPTLHVVQQSVAVPHLIAGSGAVLLGGWITLGALMSATAKPSRTAPTVDAE